MDRIAYFAIASLFRLLSLIPLRLLRWVGRQMGELAWLLKTDARSVTQENLRICFPDLPGDQSSALAREHLHHLGMTALELGLVWRGSTRAVLKRFVRVTGHHHMEEALARGKGVILLGPHIGNWEALGIYLSEHFSMTFMYQPPESPALDRLVQEARKRNGAELVPTNTSGVKSLLRALKRGEVVGVLPDQVPPANTGGGFAPFFGTPALTSTLCYNLIRRTGARAVLGYAKRISGSGDFEIVFIPAPEGLYADDEQSSLVALNAGVEATVNDAPEQYQWEYKRFRKQPDGKIKYYRKNGPEQTG